MKDTSEMTFNEVVSWAKGEILIAIGEGNYQSAVWKIVNQAWKRGYDLGRESCINDNAKLEVKS